MTDTTRADRPPLGIRVLHALRRDPDWSAMTDERLAAFRDAENRRRASRLLRVVTGRPHRGVTIQWQQVPLPGRTLPVRVYRPPNPRDRALPLVVHVHGGGFVGTAVQSDWVNSHLAARLPAVVVSVEHRLLAPGTPLQAAVDDGWDVLRHVTEQATTWAVDPARTALLGESAGALISALAALRAREAGLPLRAQVLVNPALDLTETTVEQPPDSPTLSQEQIRFFLRLAAPPGTDPRALSPLLADDLSGLAPALVVVPTLDLVAEQGRRYAGRLRAAGTPVRLTEHPGAPHAFLSMPGLVPQAKAALADIAGFLLDRVTEQR